MKIDTAQLYASRYALRQAHATIRALRAADTSPLLMETLNRLDAMCVTHTRMLEAIQPELPLAVVHPVLVEAAVEWL